MEVIGVASSAASLLSLTLDVYRKVSLFLLAKKDKNRLWNERSLQRELLSMTELLIRLQEIMLKPELSSATLQLDSVVGDSIKVLEALARTYSYQPSKSRLRRLTWSKKSLYSSDAETDLAALSRCREVLQARAVHLDLKIEQGSERPRLSEDTIVTDVRSRTLQWLSPLDHREKLNELRQKRISLQNGIQGQGTLQDLSGGSHVYKQQMAKIESWRISKQKPNVLWCHGVAGSGKTMLTSSIIDSLLRDAISTSTGLAYYFFDYKSRQPLSHVAAILLKQLCLQTPNLPTFVEDLYEASSEDGQRPLLGTLLRAIHSLSSQFQRTYIILDAIDEHDSWEGKEMAQLFQALQTLQCSILITSRLGASDVEKAFPSGLLTLRVGASFQDICSYIDWRIEESSALQYLDNDSRSKIVKELAMRAKEVQREENRPDSYNFLLAVLQVDWLLAKFTTQRDISIALENIPLSFQDTLNEASQRIKSQPASDYDLAMSALMWILFAKRALSVTELCQALAIEEDGLSLNEKATPTPRQIQMVCAGLIAVDGASSTVSLVHYSVHQYFWERRADMFPQGPRCLALACIIYLSQKSLKLPDDTGKDQEDLALIAKSNPLDDGDVNNTTLDADRLYPFSNYAVSQWICHCQERHRDEVPYQKRSDIQELSYLAEKKVLESKITKLTLKLLCLPKVTSVSLDVVTPGADGARSLVTSRGSNEISQLHLAARFGLLDEVQYLLEHNRVFSDMKARSNITVLHEAAKQGMVEIARLLVSYGADPASQDSSQKIPLHHAASFGHLGMMEYLDEHGAPNHREEDVGASFAAAEKDGQVIVAHAEQYTALRNYQDNKRRTPLHLAAANGHLAVVQSLCARDADLSLRDIDERSALHLAVMSGHRSVIAELLSNGCAVDSVDKHGLTSLHHAARRGLEPVVRRLLRCGADLSARDNEQQTALHHATMSKSSAVISILLTNGADINDQDREGQTALYKAIEAKDINIAKLLLDRGADFELTSKGGRSALHLAAQTAQEDIVSLLLRYGAKSDIRYFKGLTASDYANESKDYDIVNLPENATPKNRRKWT